MENEKQVAELIVKINWTRDEIDRREEKVNFLNYEIRCIQSELQALENNLELMKKN